MRNQNHDGELITDNLISDEEYSNHYTKMINIAREISAKSKAILIGSMGVFLTYPQVLNHKPMDVDFFVDGNIDNIKKIISILKENEYKVYSWEDEICSDFNYDILTGRYYIRGIRDGLKVDITYEIEGLTYEELSHNRLLVDDICTCDKEGFIKTLEVCDREDSKERLEKLKKF